MKKLITCFLVSALFAAIFLGWQALAVYFGDGGNRLAARLLDNWPLVWLIIYALVASLGLVVEVDE